MVFYAIMTRHPPPFQEEETRPRINGWTVGICLFVTLWILGTILNPFWLSPQMPHTEVRAHDPMIPLEPAPPDPINYHRITDLLVDAIIHIESGGNPNRVGGVGERGLMQIRENTWRDVTRRHFGHPLPFDQAFDPELNRRVGQLYLGELQDFLYRHRDAWSADMRSLLFAAYNAGPSRVRDAGFAMERMPASTRDYARRASALHDWYLERDDAILLHDMLNRAAPHAAPPPTEP